jgi:hypothetical protein
MPVSIIGNSGIQFPDSSLQSAAASPYVLKNRIINGDMVISQRNGTSSVTPTASGYTLDRWRAGLSVSSKFSVQQTTTAPTGFNYSLKATSLSAYTVGAAETFIIGQYIEGYNFADLGWGTANAKTITLSFWVQSSLTGTFGGSIRNDTPDRSYPFTYTISAANTWEYKTITIAGDTTGTWLTTNGTGAIITWALGAGSSFSGTAGAWAAANYTSATGATSVVGTNGATFYITGVQLEQNTTATPFERRLYNQELANCQRYYYKKTGALYQTFGTGYAAGTTNVVIQIYHPIEMRAAPTIAMGGTLRLIEGGAVPTAISGTQVGVTGGYIVLDSTGLTQYRPYGFGANNDTTAFLSGAAEL